MPANPSFFGESAPAWSNAALYSAVFSCVAGATLVLAAQSAPGTSSDASFLLNSAAMRSVQTSSRVSGVPGHTTRAMAYAHHSQTYGATAYTQPLMSQGQASDAIATPMAFATEQHNPASTQGAMLIAVLTSIALAAAALKRALSPTTHRQAYDLQPMAMAATSGSFYQARQTLQPLGIAADDVDIDVENLDEEKKDKKSRERGDATMRSPLGTAQPAFVSCRLADVAVNFGTQEVLKGATWEVKTGDRVGLVGANGGGKSTQLKLLMGEIELAAGEIVKVPEDLKLAFLRQEFYDELDKERTLKEELMSVFSEEAKIEKELKEANEELDTCLDDADRMQELIEKITELQIQYDRKEISRLDSKVEKTIGMMGFATEDADLKVSAFSGGWKMRIGLGKILLQEPNIMLLDEPTNHLDLATVEWMEDFLCDQDIPMVIVSHDREFLNRVATRIVDCEAGMTTTYEGNYEAFMKQKAARMKKWESEYAKQQKQIKEAKQFINQNKMNPSKAAQCSKKERDIERLEKEGVKRPPTNNKPFVFRFPDAPRLNEEVATLQNVTHGYEGNTLFDNLSLRVQPGEKIAFLGPNGAGKSTLLRLILGTEEPSEGGQAGLGHPSVIANYFEQNQADALDLTKTVMRTVEEVADPDTTQNELRALLGKFLFKGDSVFKKVSALSGGEKARLSLCRMMLSPANLIVLDEPTNHLDIPAKEMLEEALQHFDGTVVIVSHDRYFVSQTATTIIDVENKGVTRYEGDYRYYMDKNEGVQARVESRYMKGSKGIQNAKVIDLEAIQKEAQKKKLSKHMSKGANVGSGKKDKGVKNAKRAG